MAGGSVGVVLGWLMVILNAVVSIVVYILYVTDMTHVQLSHKNKGYTRSGAGGQTYICGFCFGIFSRQRYKNLTSLMMNS